MKVKIVIGSVNSCDKDWHQGEIADLPDSSALKLIRNRWAEAVETAAAEPVQAVSEVTAQPKPARKRKSSGA